TGPIPQVSVSAPVAPSSSRCVAATTRITRRTLPRCRGSLEGVIFGAVAKISYGPASQWYIARNRTPFGLPCRGAQMVSLRGPLPRARDARGEELGERTRRRDALAPPRTAEAERLAR